jgi:hypothetical protein
MAIAATTVRGDRTEGGAVWPVGKLTLHITEIEEHSLGL